MSGSEQHVVLPRFEREQHQVREQQPRREQIASATPTVTKRRRPPLDRSRSSPLWRDRGFLGFCVSGLLVLVGWYTALEGHENIATPLHVLATFVGSYRFAREGLMRAVRRRQATLELMLSVVIVVALLTGEVAIAAFIAFVYSITQVGVAPPDARPAKSTRRVPLGE